MTNVLLIDWLMSAVDMIGQTMGGGSTAKVSDFTSFSDLMNTMVKSGFNGKITDPTEVRAALWFYHHWGNYLQPNVGILSYLWTVLGWLVTALYNVTAALENVFNSLFKLFGLFGYLSDPNTLLGKFYLGFQVLGIAIFTLLAVIQIIVSIFGKPFKYKDAFLHFLLVTGVCAVLPFTITKVSSVLYTDLTDKNYGIENITGKDNKKDSIKDSLAIQPVKNNVTDIMQLIKDDFNTKKYPLDRYGNIKSNGNYNSITDDPSKRDTGDFITHIDFGASLGATDTETLASLEKNKKMKGIKGLFLHYPSDTGVAIKSVDEHRLLSGANLAEKVYSRYKTNFLAIYAQYIVLIILLAMMCVKMVTSIFELIVTGLVAPIQGYSSVTSSSKFKELLLTITGTIAGIYFEVIIMRIVLEIMRDFPTIMMTTYDSNGNIIGKSASFFSGMTPFESAIASIVVYLGLFFGAMRGVTIVERWLGVSVGQNDIAQQVMGGMMVANAMGQGATATGQLVAGLGSGAVSAAKHTPDMLKKAGGGLSQATGFVAGVGDQVQKQGLGTAAKSGIMNVHDKVAGGLQDKSQAATDSLKESFDKGEEKGNNAMKNNYPTADDYLNKRADFDDAMPRDSEGTTDPSDDPNENSVTPSGSSQGLNDQTVESSDTNPLQEDSNSEKAGGLNVDTPENEDSDVSAAGLRGETPSEGEPRGLNAASENGSSTEAESTGGLQGETPSEGESKGGNADMSENEISTEAESIGGLQGDTSSAREPGGLNADIPKGNEAVAHAESVKNRPSVEARPTGGLHGNSEPSQSTLGATVVQETPSNRESDVPNTPPVSTYDHSVTHTEAQNVKEPSNLQKARQNYQQANSTLTQGLQQMTSGKSHIKGRQVDEDK